MPDDLDHAIRDRGVAPVSGVVEVEFAQLKTLWQSVAAGDRLTASVLADQLQDRGDPRGRFIALQLVGTLSALDEAAELLRANRELWLGPFRSLVVPGSDVWRLGVLRGFRAVRQGSWPAVECDAWRTIEQLDLEWCGVQAALPLLRRSKVIRGLRGLRPWDEVDRVLRDSGATLHVERVQVEGAVTTSRGPHGLVSSARERWSSTLPPELQIIEVGPHAFGLPGCQEGDWPRPVHIWISGAEARELPRWVAWAVHRARERGVVLEFWVGDGPALEIHLLGGAAVARIWLKDGHRLVAQEVIRTLGQLPLHVQVIGRPTDATRRRLTRWMAECRVDWVDCDSEDDTARVCGGLRVFDDSWVVSTPLSAPLSVHVRRDGRDGLRPRVCGSGVLAGRTQGRYRVRQHGRDQAWWMASVRP